VDEVKEGQKDHYLVTGRVDNVTVQATFLVLPDLRSTLQVSTLSKGRPGRLLRRAGRLR
jgi:hypothetical protein